MCVGVEEQQWQTETFCLAGRENPLELPFSSSKCYLLFHFQPLLSKSSDRVCKDEVSDSESSDSGTCELCSSVENVKKERACSGTGSWKRRPVFSVSLFTPLFHSFLSIK